MNKFIEVIQNSGVVTISLNRPEIHNAFNSEMIGQLIKVFKDIETNKEVRAVVLTGNGKSFCAGADLNWMSEMIHFSQEENLIDSLKLANLFKQINHCPVPIIGKINGSALGGGVGLCAVCDYVVAIENASFGFTEVKLGLIPAVISPYVISKIGESNARNLFLSGKRFNTTLAKQIGLIHEVASSDTDLNNFVNEYIKEVLSSGPEAVKSAKSLIKSVINIRHDGEEALNQFTSEFIAKVRTRNEGQEGMKALLEKRRPNWRSSDESY
ncbi:MAG: enoyl-CoA hydratase/isomerase family protein [Halobacteriovoraceae bacterium]|nr:enoyl-CoA hydratase/isomerase family protein [Halobacteriovoraceae bacterium]